LQEDKAIKDRGQNFARRSGLWSMQRKRVERLRFEQWFSSIRASLDKAKLAEVLGSNPASSIFLVRENWGIVLSLNFEVFAKAEDDLRPISQK
jgi:hypothetical protein